MIANMISNEKPKLIVTGSFLRGKKLNIFLVFITQSYFAVPKDIRLNSTCYFLMKISNNRKLQQIAINHWSDIDFQDFRKIYKNSQQNHTAFQSTTQLYSQPILCVLDKIF